MNLPLVAHNREAPQRRQKRQPWEEELEADERDALQDSLKQNFR